MKPLEQKSYGSIPHLPGSRLGPAERHISGGQVVIATEKKRDKHDTIIVQEKLDGSNVSIAKVNDQILALGRSGYLASTSKYKQHQYFDLWVRSMYSTFYTMLEEGERICGEWLLMAHGTRYDLKGDPFIPFDIMTGMTRLPYEQFIDRVEMFGLTPPKVLSIGDPFTIEQAISAISISGHGAIDEVEGAIWRVERKGEVDFLAKYVRHDKQDGKYFAERFGKETWNVDLNQWLKQFRNL